MRDDGSRAQGGGRLQVRVALDVGPVRAEPAGVGQYVLGLAHALTDALPEGWLSLIGRHPDAQGLPDALPSSTRPRNVPYPAWLELASSRDGKRLGAELIHYTDGLVPPIRWGRTVVTVHDLSIVRLWRDHPVRRWPRIPFALAAPHLADVVVVPSRATADEVMRLTSVPAGRIEVIPNAPQRGIGRIDEPALATTLSRYGLTQYRYILAPGTIEPRKNQMRLVMAFERLPSTRVVPDDVVLAIAGGYGWGHRRVLAAIERSPARSRIRLLGYVPVDELAALLTGAGVVAYPSLYEGFGMPVVEAMACGAVTVTSNISSMPEVAGDAGFLIDPTDADDIARGIREAWVSANSDRVSMSAASMRQAWRFSWSASARRLEELYRRLGRD